MAERLRDGQDIGEGKVYMKGFLQKRQRGKHIKKESQRKKLKFQDRFCVLNSDFLLYSKKENSKVKGSFSMENIRVVTGTDISAFKKGTVAKPELCFQIGDEEEMLYFRAQDEEMKIEWMEAFKQAASDKGNLMMQSYHSGAYGSREEGKWSCCERSGKQAQACSSVLHKRAATYTSISIASDDTVISDTATTSSLQHSSSCHSNASYTLLDTQRHLELVKFEIVDTTTKRRSRADTMSSESGIHINRNAFSSIGSSGIESDIVHYSSEESVNGDEGIESDGWRQDSLDIEDKDISLKNNAEDKTDKKRQPCEKSLYLSSSHKLSHPLRTLILHHSTLITGEDKLQTWDTTTDISLELTLTVAGEVASLDTWNDYVAVGSSVVQLIQLKPFTEPKRILYTNATSHFQTISDTKSYLVAFLGDEGDLATVIIGGNTVDIWGPPPSDSQVVFDPKSSITLNSGVQVHVLSLAASRDSNYPWMATIAGLDGHMKLYIVNWRDSIICKSVDLCDSDFRPLSLNRGSSLPHICHVRETFFVVGGNRTLDLLDGQTGNTLCSIMIDGGISCINCFEENIIIGAENGEMKIFSNDLHTELINLNDRGIGAAAAVAIACDADLSSMYVAHSNGEINVWKDTILREPSSSENFEESLLGMQLCSEGILSKRRLYHPSSDESLSISYESEKCHLQLPQEALNFPKASVELAFAPFGPVGPHFIFPDGMIPVSPAAWICFSPSTQFQQPAILKLPHCFECKSVEDSNSLYFLKANHECITKDERGQAVIKFKKVDKSRTEFPPNTQYGLLREYHFCIYCMAVESRSQEGTVVGKVNYCLTILKPKRYPTNDTLKIYCIVHFDLDGCKQLIREHCPDDYDCVEKLLQFETSRYDSAIEIKVDKKDAEDEGWMITLESEQKIYAEDVNFFNYRLPRCLGQACEQANFNKAYPYAYPPKFAIEVSSRDATRASVVELRFKGAHRELSTQIQLHPLRTERDLVPQWNREDNHGGGIGSGAPLQFGTNGMWQDHDQ